MKKLFTLSLIVILSAGLFTSCKKDNGNPPTLPPKESLKMDFTNFETAKKSVDLISAPKGVEDTYWNFAALVVGYWRSIVVGTVAVPMASFELALTKTPVFLENKTWQWSYSVTVLSVTYKARLTGQIRSSDVLWKMYITREGTGGFPEFLWFEGTSKSDGTGGTWTLNHSQQFVEPLLQIVWTKTGTTLTTVKYSYVRELNNARAADPFKTSYVEFSRLTGTYDCKFTIHYWNGTAFSNVEIEWNKANHLGRVKSSDFLAGAWYAWDGNYGNI
jgi:hypothetical protein